jgi:hypothetical protein
VCGERKRTLDPSNTATIHRKPKTLLIAPPCPAVLSCAAHNSTVRDNGCCAVNWSVSLPVDRSLPLPAALCLSSSFHQRACRSEWDARLLRCYADTVLLQTSPLPYRVSAALRCPLVRCVLLCPPSSSRCCLLCAPCRCCMVKLVRARYSPDLPHRLVAAARIPSRPRSALRRASMPYCCSTR